ncbi:hypothetical protein SK128_012748 [Halocaridina rubra]|uniref:Uncharacterized protein n=1 Tax=Halocaridina rubra TaxID=373956 RepID=A0AAN8ZZ91_HALRR
MLKFRVTNSMKARRAAEAQRKALEEKLQLEWAWKPMAAVMNERQTDLVYWIPPLYRNNIRTAGSRVRRKSLAHRSSLHRSSLAQRLPYTHLQAAHLYSQLHASQRRKKLSSRRAKLHTEVSFESTGTSAAESRKRLSCRRSKLHTEFSFESTGTTATEADSGVLDSRSEWEDTKDEDGESGIHDETADANVDDMSLLNVQSIQEEEVPLKLGTMKRRLGEHRRISRGSATRTSIKPAVPPKPQFITTTKPEYRTPKPDYIARSFEAIDKPKPAPTLLRLLEKVSHIHSTPFKAIKPTKPELKKIHRRGSEPKVTATKKVKRPSVKVYGNPATRHSGRKAKAANEEDDLENQCVVVSVDHKPKEIPPPLKIPQEIPKYSKEFKDEPCKDEAETRNAQLQMILRLLAQLYEERVTRQDTEIQNLKMRIQTQDKLMKQMAHVVLELKEEVSKMKMIKSPTLAVPHNSPNDISSNVLHIKVG